MFIVYEEWEIILSVSHLAVTEICGILALSTKHQQFKGIPRKQSFRHIKTQYLIFRILALSTKHQQFRGIPRKQSFRHIKTQYLIFGILALSTKHQQFRCIPRKQSFRHIKTQYLIFGILALSTKHQQFRGIQRKQSFRHIKTQYLIKQVVFHVILFGTVVQHTKAVLLIILINKLYKISSLCSSLACSVSVEIACCVINVRSNLELGSVGNL